MKVLELVSGEFRSWWRSHGWWSVVGMALVVGFVSLWSFQNVLPSLVGCLIGMSIAWFFGNDRPRHRPQSTVTGSGTAYCWISWYAEPTDSFSYRGPWWVTGEDMRGRFTVCAAVAVDSEEEAREAIIKAHRREREFVWRFAEMRFSGEPFGGRFPRERWMRWPWPRLAKGG